MDDVLGELFGDDAVVESQAVEQPEDWKITYGGRVALDAQSAEWTFFEVLTVPDAGRVKCPVPAPSDPERVDLSSLERLSAGEVKSLVGPSLPDDQLQSLYEYEFQTLEKPRKVAGFAIRSELNRRGAAECAACGQQVESFDQWVKKTAADPHKCCIVGIVLAVGAGEPLEFLVGRDGEEEEALNWFWDFVIQRGERNEFANPDWINQWRTIQVRSLFHDVGNRQGEFLRPITGRGMAIGGADINKVAAAYGLQVPFVPSAGALYQQFIDCHYSKVSQIGKARIEASRAVLLAERSIF